MRASVTSPQEFSAEQAWPAPAKLNLFLHVLGQQADGYHELQTLFQILDWGDELWITTNDSGVISRHCQPEAMCDAIPESGDVCVRAARLLQTHCGVIQGAHISLLKNIPLGSGLGGGSSDAATVLVALNQMWCCDLSRDELAQLGLQIGADVPVFIHGHSAWAQGRGENLQAVSLGAGNYVLVFPPFGISTAKVFQYPGLKRDSEPLDWANTAKVALKPLPESEVKGLLIELADFVVSRIV